MFGAVSLFLAVGAAPRDLSKYSFEAFESEYRKAYASTTERAARRNIFESNLAEIAAQNARYEAGTSSWYAGVHDFTDQTRREFMSTRAGRLLDR